MKTKFQPHMSDPVRPPKRQRSDPSVAESSSCRSKPVMTAQHVADAPSDVDRMMLDAKPGTESVQGVDREPLISEPSAEHFPVEILDTVPDELGDATHARLDKAVLDEAPPWKVVLGVSDNDVVLALLTSLLVSIVSESEGHLDPQFEKQTTAKTLISRHPELVDMLQAAWQAGTFKEIRNLGAFLVRGCLLNAHNISFAPIAILRAAVPPESKEVVSLPTRYSTPTFFPPFVLPFMTDFHP